MILISYIYHYACSNIVSNFSKNSGAISLRVSGKSWRNISWLLTFIGETIGSLDGHYYDDYPPRGKVTHLIDFWCRCRWASSEALELFSFLILGWGGCWYPYSLPRIVVAIFWMVWAFCASTWSSNVTIKFLFSYGWKMIKPTLHIHDSCYFKCDIKSTIKIANWTIDLKLPSLIMTLMLNLGQCQSEIIICTVNFRKNVFNTFSGVKPFSSDKWFSHHNKRVKTVVSISQKVTLSLKITSNSVQWYTMLWYILLCM